MTHRNNDKERDPVCGMWVEPEQYPLDYQGMHFAFCTPQCRKRFLENPQLYLPGHRHTPAAQTIKHLRKHRRFRLTTSPDSQQRDAVHACLSELMGIDRIAFEDRDLVIDYDLLETDARQVSSALKKSGIAVANTPWQRLRRFAIHYLERTQLDALEKSDNGGHRHG